MLGRQGAAQAEGREQEARAALWVSRVTFLDLCCKNTKNSNMFSCKWLEKVPFLPFLAHSLDMFYLPILLRRVQERLTC